MRDVLATYREAEDLVNIGAYVAGSNPRVDHALARIDQVRPFLRQGIYERSTFDDAQRAVMDSSMSREISISARSGARASRAGRTRAGRRACAGARAISSRRSGCTTRSSRSATSCALQLVREHAHFDAETLRSTYTHLDYLDRAIVASLQRVEACAAETERARARLVDAAKDRKVLETLKERRREAFQLDAALADQRELDDQNARLFDRAHPFEGLPS